MCAEQAANNRRDVTRDDCEIGATVVFDSERIPCVIRDLSDKGAKIVLASTHQIPGTFDLQIPHLPGVEEARRCELRWQVGDIIGLRFLHNSAFSDGGRTSDH